MKDASGPKSSRPNSDLDESDPKRRSDPKEKPEKQKRKRLRKRRGSNSPEEDIIDGFVIASYSSLCNLEILSSCNASDGLPPLEQNDIEKSKRIQEIEEKVPRPSVLSSEKTLDSKKSKNVAVREVSNGIDSHTDVNLSRQFSPGRMTDDSSDSGNSGKGYICDGESDDEQVPPEKKSKPSLISGPVTETKPKPEVVLDLSKDDDEDDTVKKEKSFEIGFDTQKSILSPKSSSFHTPSLSFSSSSSLTISQSPRTIPQSSWLPRLSSSSFKKPLSVVEPCYGPGTYSGPEAIHQELNNRFLQSHSELERNPQHAKPNSREMHQHSHLHHHQHQHTHYYPSPLLTPSYFTPPAPAPRVLSPFSAPVPTYHSRVISPFNKKTGKWCSAHVRIAWEIFYNQRGEISKDSLAKLEGISISKPSTAIIPPFPSPSRHGTGSDLGYSHPHFRRFSGSPFGKPPLLIPRSTSSTNSVTSSISAFSSVSSPPSASRRPSSPLIIPRSSSEPVGRRSPSSGPSMLYPWLKSEPKTPDLELEKHRREFHTKSPARPSNFTIQALAGDRTEAMRPSTLGDSSRSHSSRDHRVCETRSFLDNPLVPSLVSLDKRPMDYHRTTTGSIDLNRNSLYPRLEPMHTLYSHHVPPLTPHMTGYYPGSPFITDYHPEPGRGMVLGGRDSMTSLVRPPDIPFFVRHDLDDRLGGRR